VFSFFGLNRFETLGIGLNLAGNSGRSTPTKTFGVQMNTDSAEKTLAGHGLGVPFLTLGIKKCFKRP
jgi:hypothetical protein